MEHFSFGRIEGRKRTIKGEEREEKLFLWRLFCLCKRLQECQAISSVIEPDFTGDDLLFPQASVPPKLKYSSLVCI